MKLVSLPFFVATAFSTLSAFAQAPAVNPNYCNGKNIPSACVAPCQACIKAGFIPGAHKKGDKEGVDDGLWVDCIDAAADNKKTVAGLSSTDAGTCRAAKKAMKH